jgi:hypothetical protein
MAKPVNRGSGDQPPKSDFFKPVNLIGFVLGVAGLAFGIYSHIKSKPTYEVSYSIVQKERLTAIPQLEIGFFDKRLNKNIEKDICVANIYFWVSGDAVIEPKIIRRPISIEPPEGTEIYRLKSVGAGGASDLTLAQAGNKIEFRFSFLDPGSWVSAQVAYSCFNGTLAVAGAGISDQPLTRSVAYERSDQPFSSLIGIGAFAAAFFVLFVLWDRVARFVERVVKRPPWLGPLLGFMMGLASVFAGGLWSGYVLFVLHQFIFNFAMPAGLRGSI